MTPPWKRRAAWAGAAVAALAVAFAWGRTSAPVTVEERIKVETRVETKAQTVEAEKRVEGPVRVVERRVEIPGPAGPTIEIVRTEERGPVTTSRDLTANTATVATDKREASKSVTSAKASWRATVSADPRRLALEPDAFRFGLERRLVGPVWIGASYQHRGAALLSVAMEF